MTERLSSDQVAEELIRALRLPDYEAVDVLWVGIIKLANTLDAKSEHDRLLLLLQEMPEDAVRDVLDGPSVDALLNLDPPLETILSHRHERLKPDRTAAELLTVRTSRAKDPRAALRSLAEVLKRIRNRRAHGFKTADGPRDREVLGAARSILRAMCENALDAVSQRPNPRMKLQQRGGA